MRQPEIFTVIIDKHNNLSTQVMTVRMDAPITLSRKLRGYSLHPCIKSYIHDVLSSSNCIRTPIVRLPRFDDGVWKSHGFSKQGTRVAKRRSRGITSDSDRSDRRLVISSTFSTLSPSLENRPIQIVRASRKAVYIRRSRGMHTRFLHIPGTPGLS